MSQTDKTADEVVDSLTGHEEMWIADQFGKSIGELVDHFLSRNDVGPYYRALIFVLKRRDGVNDDDARNAVLEMKLGDAIGFFPREHVDADEAAAVAESGKDEPQVEPSPETLLSSVS